MALGLILHDVPQRHPSMFLTIQPEAKMMGSTPPTPRIVFHAKAANAHSTVSRLAAETARFARSSSSIILRRKEVETLTGLSRSTIYDKMSKKSPRFDPDFPQPVQLGSRAVGWKEGELMNWIENRSKGVRQ